MQNKDKGLNRGGIGGQEGELDRMPETSQDLNRKPQGRQQGGIGKEPNLEKKQPQNPPSHISD